MVQRPAPKRIVVEDRSYDLTYENFLDAHEVLD